MSRTEGLRNRKGRGREAGVTLVEMLVVVALIGTLAGAVGLGIGSATRGPGAQEEAVLLAARMRRAGEEAVLAAAPVAIQWSEEGYRFLALADGAWAPHPVALLGEARTLDGGVRFGGEAPRGAFAVTAASLPAGGAPLTLRLDAPDGGPAEAVLVTWDGTTAATGALP